MQNGASGELTVSKSALFLDRDGVINVDSGYVHKVSEFVFCDGIFDVVRTANQNHMPVIVVTNQSGIGRGYFSEEDFHELTQWMHGKFVEMGSRIDHVYFSPYHPTEGINGYRKDDYSRKPHPGMLFQAQHELGLKLDLCILIGDKMTDIAAGQAAGVGCNILLQPKKQNDSDEAQSFHRINHLNDAIPFISKYTPGVK